MIRYRFDPITGKEFEPKQTEEYWRNYRAMLEPIQFETVSRGPFEPPELRPLPAETDDDGLPL